ncbi:hypothetical protein A3I50_04625 [Candidatus Roizmanbacteria bacterium RIFCSPLOWO2_02_FULL_37_9]|uniref:PPM-type phosphatase domain-containing protein n=1 Tax=Candidatus Roizmanbacteria bacterium RIFCSPLOWO2_01_FULL_37_16 TaxID=1802058 RepID=A0A1F7IPJ4_9BACT|nr:MAG: hypothetical protein A3F57_06330 [Candidatus Roizmanbacteria bacterium RIFCSPHIGHO2_12_FULL_36_11]OGK45279.1 MAG: hypothetical protein A3B40_05030 [Candidatus Roizmanbacteria bacterium RIFCSPLOWO2_01_FULL_37_16]OGK56727.1 MAG: hypothetical protein A3I50_04625 [Candidatus Roizmanbacteria bacterium RIFCSPLOWO2_02_FULL_37_9]
MKIDFLLDIGEGETNEDNLLVKDNLFGVFDGLTSLNKYKDQNGKTGGQIASQLVKRIFEKNIDKDFKFILHKAQESLNQGMINRNIDISSKTNRLSSSIAVVKLKNGNAEYIQVGDSPIIFIFKNGSFKIVMSNKNTDKESLLLWKKLSGRGIKSWSEDKEILNNLIKVRQMANVTFGSFNGEEEVFKFILHDKLNLDNVTNILLLTDGLFLPQEDPNKGEVFDTLVKFYLVNGLTKLKDYVRNLEESDSKCIKYPRFKKHDDIAAISVDFK